MRDTFYCSHRLMLLQLTLMGHSPYLPSLTLSRPRPIRRNSPHNFSNKAPTRRTAHRRLGVDTNDVFGCFVDVEMCWAPTTKDGAVPQETERTTTMAWLPADVKTALRATNSISCEQMHRPWAQRFCGRRSVNRSVTAGYGKRLHDTEAEGNRADDGCAL